MAQIKQVGVGRKTTGTIDGITYYVLNGKTFARSTPTMPVSMYTSTEARIRQAIFKFVQMHMKLHLRTIRQTFTAKTGTPCNRYYSMNKKGLNAALQTLAEQYVDGLDVTITDIEAAISAYAAEHPTSIVIGHLSGYKDVYLTGEWPATITLNAQTGDSTVIIIISENGTTTTINADGTTSSGSSQGSDAGGASEGSGAGGASQGTDTGGTSDTGNSETPGTNTVPRLTINRYGTGSASVTANGSTVTSGSEVAANTELSISITPAEGATPTASLGGNSVTLSENEGIYTGTATMPASNATLTINTGGDNGGGSGPDSD